MVALLRARSRTIHGDREGDHQVRGENVSRLRHSPEPMNAGHCELAAVSSMTP